MHGDGGGREHSETVAVVSTIAHGWLAVQCGSCAAPYQKKDASDSRRVRGLLLLGHFRPWARLGLGGATRVTRRRFRLDGEERLEYILSPHLAPVGCLAPHPLLQLFHPNVRNSWLFHEGRTATTDDANFVFFARVKPGSLTLGVA